MRTVYDMFTDGDKNEMADFLCRLMQKVCDCDECPAQEKCMVGRIGFLPFLEEEEEYVLLSNRELFMKLIRKEMQNDKQAK